MLDSNSLKDFFYIIRLGLGQEQILDKDTSLFKWKELYQIAKHQSLIGIFVDGIMCLSIEKRPVSNCFLEWVAIAAKIERSNLLQNKVLCEFISQCNHCGYSGLLLKGQGIAQCYPNPLRRQCGDIDLYFGPDQFEDVNKFIRTIGGKESHHENLKHSSWNYKGVEFENHRVSTTFNNKYHQNYFSGLLDESIKKPLKCNIGNSTVLKPSLRFDCIYILKHCVDHFLDQGLGLRQPMDWLQLISTNANEIDKELFVVDLKKTGLYNAAVAFAWIGVTYLGYPVEKIYIAIPEYSALGQTIFDDILVSGNFGHDDLRFPLKNRNVVINKWYGFKRALERSRRFKCIFPEEAECVTKNKIKKIMGIFRAILFSSKVE